MVSFDWKYKDEIQHCSECGKQMSSFEIGLDHDLCSDCRAYHQDEKEAEIRRLESRIANTVENKRLADEEIRNLLENSDPDFESDFQEKFGVHPDEVKAHQDQCCRHCGEHKDDCSCGCHDNGTYSGRYSDPPDEHEFQGDYDYDDYDRPGDRLYSDPDDDEVFF